MGLPISCSGWSFPRFVQNDAPPAVSSALVRLIWATFATHAQFGLLRNLGGSDACRLYTSARTYAPVVTVAVVDVAPTTTPVGCAVPVPVANAASSSRSFASARRRGSCCPKSVSERTSNEPNTHAAAFSGVITMFPTVGDASTAATPSASHAAVTPADVTPFHVLLVVVLTLLTRRYGFALALFVSTIVGSSTNGRRYPPDATPRFSAARATMSSGFAMYFSNAS